ncbi:MAG: TldD/PmbA family protein [Nanoarchaeota archaeon]
MTTDTQIRDNLTACIQFLTKKGFYADALYMNSTQFSLRKDNTSFDADEEADRGVRLRIYVEDRFLDRSISGCDKKDLMRAARLLIEEAHRYRPLARIPLKVDTKRLKRSFRSKMKEDPRKIPLKEKIKYCEELHTRFSDEQFVNIRVAYTEGHTHEIFVNQHRVLSQKIPRVIVAVMPFVRTPEGQTRYHYRSFFAPGFEATRISTAEVRSIKKMARAIINAGRIPPGSYTCYLPPDMTGLLAHESFGHGMEADTVMLGRAKSIEYFGQRIAPEEVSILDDPSYAGAHGHIFFDHEGQLASPTYLVKNGIVTQPITCQYAASFMAKKGFGWQLTANARAESYDHKIYARMTNTYFAKGNQSPKKMLKSIRDGIYLHNASGGMEDPKGWGVQIQGITAERIKDGKRTGEFFYEAGMTGYLPKLLSNITAVGSDFTVPGTGFCGKGHKEWVPVSDGGPSLVIEEVPLS